ncbi:hypothetical protein V8D89_002516 [Ganoderma adspersum]
MDIAQSDVIPDHGLIGAQAPLQMVIDDVENIQIQRRAIDDKIAQLETYMKHQMDLVHGDLRSLMEKVDKMTEEVDDMTEDVNEMREDVNEMKLQLTTVTQFTNAQRVEKAVQSNMMRPRPEGLHQVPGPRGTLPWNTRIHGPNGGEIVLAPLVSLEDVHVLGASQLGAYVQFYYPGHEVPEDLKERKKMVLMAIGRSRESYEIV